jgi:hypothetical protein
VNTNRDCSWSAQATAGWIHLGAANGQGEGSIPFSVDANPQTTERGGTIDVSNAGQVAVTQAAQPPPPPPPPTAPDPTTPAPGPSPAPNPPPPSGGQSIELKGEVVFLVGRCPDLGFLLSLQAVRTNSDTEFKGLKCSDMENGRKVKVEGVVRNDGIVIATVVKKD